MVSRDHTYYQDLLEQHVSGAALSPEQRMDFFDHIEECDDCREMLEAEERLTARMKTIPKMVAPSDLRARIVRQAVSEHTERTTIPCNDPRFADILSCVPAKSAPDGDTPASTDPAAVSMPYFAGVQRSRPSRVRRAWRSASPVMAMAFLAVAGVGALYTGQFQGIPGVAQVQRGLWTLAGHFSEDDDHWGGVATLAQSDGSASRQPAASVPFPAAEGVDNSAVAATVAAPEATGAPGLTGSGQMEQIVRLSAAVTESVNSTMASLARAAHSQGIPAPAEKSAPQIAAVVLKATDSAVPQNAGGFLRQSEIATALEALSRKYPDSRLTSEDQFTMSGNRYRVYTLELPEGSTHQIIERLSPYQAPLEETVVTALASQAESAAVSTSAFGGADSVRFFSGQEVRLRSALEQISPVSAAPGTGREQLRVVVVE